MSKPWSPKVHVGGRPAGSRRLRRGVAKQWGPHRPRRRARFSEGELRLTLLGSLLLGFAVAHYGSWENRDVVPDFAEVAAPDPYAESRRSKRILEAQEGAPPSAFAGGAASGAIVVGGTQAVDVIDGDTFRLDGESIRIADIDTPEVNGRCAYESALAERATQRLAVLLAAAPFEMQPAGRDEDRYGRKLRIVTRGGHSLGDQLVAEGLARTWTGRREPWC